MVNASSVTPENVSQRNTVLPKTYNAGERFSRVESETASNSPPITDKDRTHITSDGVDTSHDDETGPSAFEGTAIPYLARVFNMGSNDILQSGTRDVLAEVDSYILGLVKEREWVDTRDSYAKVLQELRENLGINPNLQPLIALERLSRGVKLLKLQKMHRRRDAEIVRQIQKINKNFNDISRTKNSAYSTFG